MTVIVHEGRFTEADKAAGDYRLLPFDVSAGTRRVELRYTFERSARSVLDLGLFDARGAEFLRGEGFRGWSGSDRSHIVVTERSATPGYLPGPLPAGTWHVILGLVRIGPEGCGYRVEVTLSESEGEALWTAPPRAAAFEARRGPAWFCGDLQSHTHHSDARGTVADLAGAARARGLDFVAVTDHNTVSQHADLPAYEGADLLLIPSEEVTTYYGHANVWGLDRWLDFRCRTDEEMARVIEEAHRRGLLFSANHPSDAHCADCVWRYGLHLPIDCMEVWNGLWPNYNEQTLTMWEGLLRAGRRIVAVGGSDKHQPPLPDTGASYLLGHPTTYVWAEELTTAGILAGIRAGHVTISADVDMPRVFLTAEAGGERVIMGDRVTATGPADVTCEVLDGVGHTVRVVTGRGVMLENEVASRSERYEMRVDLGEHRYVRAEVRARVEWGDGAAPPVLALSNPIYSV